MANRYVNYIVVLLVCLCCAVHVHAQTDSAVTESDTATVEPPASSDSDSYDSHEKTGGLAKFKQKQVLQQASERKLNNGEIDALKKQNSWWYNKTEDEKNKNNSSNKGFWGFINWRLMRFVFWAVIIGAFLTIVILYLRTFTGGGRKIKAGGIATAEIQEDIFTTNFEEQVNKALADNNYRLATRLLFLRVLRTMAEKGIINYGQDKTNMDYLFELGNSRYARDFMQASRNYEYVWYGNFIPAQSQFIQIRQQLDDLNQKITG